MVNEAAVDELATLLGWTEHFEPELAWAEVERAAGYRMPADFRRLMSRFPSGMFGYRFTVYSPVQSPDAAARFIYEQNISLNVYRDVRRWDSRDVPYPLYPEPGGLLPWGCGDDTFLLYRMDPADQPDRWPCVLGEGLGNYWKEYAGTASEFLLAMLSGQLPDYFEPDSEELQFYPIEDIHPPVVVPVLGDRRVRPNDSGG